MNQAIMKCWVPRLLMLSFALCLWNSVALLPVRTASAAAPFSKSDVPGFFRIMLGRFEVTALYDGAQSVDEVKFLDQLGKDTEAALKSVFLENPVPTSVNAFLVNTGTKLVLIDVGGGSLLGPTLGKLLSNLQAAGYQPGQIDDILLTHMHRDHIGGLLAEGAPAFPNAIVHADKRELDFWLSEANFQKAPLALRPRFEAAIASLTPYIAAARYKSFEDESEVVPGVHSVRSYGHTAGHSTYTVESDGHVLWLVGDLIGAAAIQLRNPRVAISFDGDGLAASIAREQMLKRASEQGILIGAAHLPFPGLGHIRAAAEAWQWLPLDYSANVR